MAKQANSRVLVTPLADDKSCNPSSVQSYHYHISSIRHHDYTVFFFTSCFCTTTIRGQHLLLWKARRHQWRLYDCLMLSVVHAASQSCCQSWKCLIATTRQPYSTNPSIIIRNHSLTCASTTILAEATVRGWHLFRSEVLIVQLLFEGGNSVYLTKYCIHVAIVIVICLLY